MPMSRIQSQRGMALPEFLRSFGTETQYTVAVEPARWPGGFWCPVLRLPRSLHDHCRLASPVPVQQFPAPDLAYGGQLVCWHQVAFDDVVSGDLPHHPGQDRSDGTGAQTPARGQLSDGLTRAPQTLASHGLA